MAHLPSIRWRPHETTSIVFFLKWRPLSFARQIPELINNKPPTSSSPPSPSSSSFVHGPARARPAIHRNLDAVFGLATAISLPPGCLIWWGRREPPFLLLRPRQPPGSSLFQIFCSCSGGILVLSRVSLFLELIDFLHSCLCGYYFCLIWFVGNAGGSIQCWCLCGWTLAFPRGRTYSGYNADVFPLFVGWIGWCARWDGGGWLPRLGYIRRGIFLNYPQVWYSEDCVPPFSFLCWRFFK